MRAPLLPLVAFAALLAAGCNKTDASAEAADAGGSKEAVEKAAATLKEPIALIAGYRPFIKKPAPKDKFTPKKNPAVDRAAQAAANEMRYAANSARQKLPSGAGPAVAEVEKALTDLTGACADAVDDEAFAKCDASVTTLDGALERAKTASGVAFPRVDATAVPSDAGKKAIARLERIRGPLPAEKAFFDKRSDPAAASGDVIAACQAAAQEVAGTADEVEKAEEPIRLVGVTHKMNVESQCHMLETVDDIQKTVQGCKKSPKKDECVAACGKAKAQVEDGVPAAAFASLEKDVATVCK